MTLTPGGWVRLPGGSWIEEDNLPDLATLGPRRNSGQAAPAMLEDLDPTPIPAGCPSCWLTAGPSRKGERCLSCPDRPNRRRRAEL